MKTIQTFVRYFPDKCGGIQIHLSELLPGLKAQGVESKVAAAQDQAHEDTYHYGGMEVYRYPAFPLPKTEPNHGAVSHGSFETFARWLKAQNADIYHQHQWAPKCGLPHLRLAKELGMTTVVTIHLPQPICQRGTLMLHGKETCDGKIDEVRCSYCCNVSKKLPAPAIKALSRVPLPAIAMMEGRFTSLELPAYVAARQSSLLEMARLADRIVPVCQWLYDALLINGVPKEKLTLCRYGVADAWQTMERPVKQPSKTLRVGFLGRWTPDKGIHILVEAVKSLSSDIPIELVIHGIAKDETYRKSIEARTAADTRFAIKPQLTREELPAALASFDVLAVPSQWLETGPLVVLEAHALGIPVVGSKLGGIVELVQHEVNGLLIQHNDVKAWAKAFARLAEDANLLAQLRQGIQPIRTISTEVADTIALYQDVLKRSGLTHGRHIE